MYRRLVIDVNGSTYLLPHSKEYGNVQYFEIEEPLRDELQQK